MPWLADTPIFGIKKKKKHFYIDNYQYKKKNCDFREGNTILLYTGLVVTMVKTT